MSSSIICAEAEEYENCESWTNLLTFASPASGGFILAGEQRWEEGAYKLKLVEAKALEGKQPLADRVAVCYWIKRRFFSMNGTAFIILISKLFCISSETSVEAKKKAQNEYNFAIKLFVDAEQQRLPFIRHVYPSKNAFANIDFGCGKRTKFVTHFSPKRNYFEVHFISLMSFF